MPSATTADRRASMPARNAIVNAEGRTSLTLTTEITGTDGNGMPVGMFGNRVPIVSILRLRNCAASTAKAIAIRYPGSFGANFRKAIITRSETIPTATVAASREVRAWKYAAHFGRKSAGTFEICKPRKSLTWLDAIMTAIPAVKPVTTGWGTYLMI